MKRLGFAIVLLALLAGIVQPVQAGWGDFFDENGNLKPGVVDLGEQKVPADWMPNVPDWVPDWLYDGAATYHMYALPSGESVLLPSATTLFFMAMNPRESGLVDSDGYITKFMSVTVVNQFSDSQSLLTHIFDIFKLPNSKELADAAIRGENVWSFLSADTIRIFTTIAREAMNKDSNLYFAMLLYSSCKTAPTGCPPELVALTQPTPQPPGSPSCAAPTVTRGTISAKAALVAPAKVLVVGQDPDKRGADLRFELTIGPTVVTYEELEQTGTETYCDLKGYTTRNCPKGHLKERPIYECVQHTVSYCEPPTWVMAEATLRQSSRDWILGDLQWYYPGAYLHHPDWSWRGGRGGCDGSNTYRWTLDVPKAQIADPGWYDLKVRGATAGTPVTTGRSFVETGGAFDAWLMMTTVIR